ncbi:probable vesicular glutamate transporter eat-4 [Caerostris darwini]|uniref:Probable vesicular glutamate transporter eat-4 n=1 Tax=Caerostris darwini TaxID=1538125 RepID=A0AAV4REG2_9ARAC|nr:probable vesicular glutamate transporter eat-4 [Caerostris darwini]
MLDFIPKRYVFSLVGLAATTLSIALMTNLSLAIVYMVRESRNEIHSQLTNECPALLKTSDNETLILQGPKGELDWSPEIQGFVLGAQYVGLAVGFIPGGRFTDVYGGKITMITTLLMASIFTAILPLIVHLPIHFFIVCRFLIGAGSAPVFPALIFMISRWIPESEQIFISSVVLAGYGTGAFVSYITAGALCASDFLGGWPSVFYMSAISGFAWSTLCYFVVYDTPDKHPSISSEELDFITKNTSQQTKQVKSIPWKAIATSVPFWALAAGNFGQCWILSFFVTSIALYMGTILNLTSLQNGLLSCLPNLLRAVFACIVGIAIDFVRRRRKIPIVYVRKGTTLANSIAACIGFGGILFSGCDITMNAIFFIIAGVLSDFYIFGVSLVPIDMAPHLAGTLSGIVWCISSIPYFLLPAMIGEFTKNERTIAQWSYIYYITIGVTVLTTLIYLQFGTSELQPWGIDSDNSSDIITKETEEKKKESKSKEDRFVYACHL